MVPSARSGEPVTPGISGGAPIISGPATEATGRAAGEGDSRRRWVRRTATAVDVSLMAPISTISALFERRPFTNGSFEVEGLRVHYEDYGTGPNVLVFVHGILLDAAINFAINAGLPGRDRTRATLEMKCEYLRQARKGERYVLRGDVVRVARQVAWAESRITDAEGELVSKCTATFLLHRPEDAAGG